jgi:hypothetical protein
MRKTISDSGPALTDVVVLVPALINGWTANAAFDPPRLYKDSAGIVHVVCALDSVGLTNVVAFTLPVGWRPTGGIEAPVTYWNGSVRVLGTCYCVTTGVALYGNNDAPVSATYWAVNLSYKAV